MTATARTINLDDAPNTGTTGTPVGDTGPGTAPPRTPAIRKLETQVHDFYAQLGTYLGLMMPDPFLGVAIAGNAEPASGAWADLAAQDPKVKAAIERVLSGGVWANVIGIHVAGIAIPVLAYYGRLPEHVSAMVLKTFMDANPGMAPLIMARMMSNDGHNVASVPGDA